MSKPVYTIFLVLLILAAGCDPQQDAFEESLPDFYTLTTQVSPDESGTVNPSGGEFLVGNSVLIEATPAEGYVFDHWEGDITGKSNPESIRFSTNKTVTAIFKEEAPEEYSLIINTDGFGTVDIDPARNIYLDGEEVKLSAISNAGWMFKEWQGDLSGNANPATILIDEDKQITAIFEVDINYGVTVSEVKLFINEMELEGARRSRDFTTRNFILNLPLDGKPFHITHVPLIPGFYEELILEIKKPGNSVEISDPDFRDGSKRYSIVVSGIFNGVDFTFQSTDDFKMDAELSPHLEITSGQTSVIAIKIDFDRWFKVNDNELLDPNDSRNANQINKNIQDSFNDFGDSF
jgi:hypothetical protein